MLTKYRIVKRGGLYYPEKRFLWGPWCPFFTPLGVHVKRATLEDAKFFMELPIDFEDTGEVVWEGRP